MNTIIMVWIFIVMSVIAVQFDLAYCKLELELTKGVIKGRILKSRDGRPYYSYTDVPYAKPPVGRLRFKAPEPVEPWNGILDATREPSVCIQQGFKDGREDCLRLNVYTPVITGNPGTLPVMVWIHGGAFTWGNSGPGLYGPDYFMDKDVVLVTVNYRLGMLGFLSTEDDAMAGNYGLKDQVEGLRWVKENIVKFNGDPGRVTIFGGSAGAACVGLHMLSPMSKGLFHKAILQSGSPVCRWAINPAGVSRKLAHSVATVAGCNFDTSQNLVECLRKLPAQYLMDLHTKFLTWLTHPSFLFNPVVENCSSGRQAFLCHHTIYEFKQESFVPAIIGINVAEGGLYVASLYNRTSLMYDEFKANFNYLFPIMVGYNHYAKLEDMDEMGEKILKKYFPSGILVDNTHQEAVKMFTDSVFTQCIFDMAYQLSSPVYGYIYSYQNEFSHNKLYGSCEKSLGVTHGDELNSLFRHNSWNPNSLNEEDLKVSKLMINIWYNFVSSANLTIDGTENGLTWPKFTRSNQQMVHFNSSYPSITENLFLDDYKFWTRLPISSSKHNS